MNADRSDGREGGTELFYQESGWTARNRTFFLNSLREAFPHVEDRDLHEAAVHLFFSHLSLAWACYEDGAAGAFPDIILAFDLFSLTRPRAITRETCAHHRAAAGGVGGSAGAGGMLNAHRKGLIKRLRYEALFVELGHRRSSTLTAISHPSIMTAAERIIKRGPIYARNITPDGYYRSCLEPAELWKTTVTLLKGVQGIGVADTPWPGAFYFPSLQTCRSLGWLDIWDAFDHLRVEPDYPVLRISHLLPDP